VVTVVEIISGLLIHCLFEGRLHMFTASVEWSDGDGIMNREGGQGKGGGPI
jgi:hypothetical protein